MDISFCRNVLSPLGSLPSLCPRNLYKEVPLGHMVLETLRKNFLSEKALGNGDPPSCTRARTHTNTHTHTQTHTHTHTHILRALSGQLLFLPAQTHPPLILAMGT